MMFPRRPRRVPSRRARVALAWVLVALAFALPGCVSRKLFLKTEPPGARVLLDGRYVGTTPYEVTFESYGTRAVDLELQGYARSHQLLPIDAPWWQVFPLDVVTDLLLPFTIEDERSFHFVLEPRDPEAGSWEDARAAYAREQALRASELSLGARPESGP